jgi:hypothetical protein
MMEPKMQRLRPRVDYIAGNAVPAATDACYSFAP